MTKEEAKEKLYLEWQNFLESNIDYAGISEAYKMAFRALEQEPCDDAISREAVDELSKKLVHTTRDKADFLCNFWEGLQKLPSVRPQEPKWISVRERLPEKNMPCLVTVGEFYLTRAAIYSDLMGTIDHKIFYQGTYGYNDFENITPYVKAWMPLPEPYKAESEDKDADSN